MVVIIFGVAGAGKTTIGRILAGELRCKFYDADDFHPAANVEKLRAGIALTDDDRAPWLARMRDVVRDAVEQNVDAVLACSALKSGYRSLLAVKSAVRFVYLRIDRTTAQERLAQRQGHFMNPALLADQFATLEEPTDPATITVDASADPRVVVAQIARRLAD